ncbi:MAG TPA: hypothetical protein VHJ77_16235, partial [Vicinamibacterales bacterium]|nr:hypothetical protein [Vicinamibacterales bacterium]
MGLRQARSPEPEAPVRIAVDAMGGDEAPRAVVDGALVAARRLGAGLILAGDRSAVTAELQRHPALRMLDVEVRHAPDAVRMDESPAAALRRKPGASIRVAADAVARHDAAALFSAGHTGATVLAAHAAFGMLPGVDRPALGVTIPT